MVFLVLAHPVFNQCYELIWSDEFDYVGFPDSTVWTFEEGGGGWGNNEIQYYKVKDKDNAWVEDGVLTITAINEDFGGRNYTSSRLITQKKFNFRYGKIEARIKLPYSQGIWPAFWMLGERFSEVGWPACGEIDIMELIGGENNDNQVHGTAHWDNNGSHASYGGTYTLDSGIFADDFHTFSVQWTPEFIRWFVDGNQYHVMDITPSELSEFQKDFFILLNVAVGGNWPGYPDETSVFPQSMEVDYVRVYKNQQDIDEIGISGKEVVAQNAANLNYTLPSSAEWTYDWSVPDEADIISGQGTHKIEVEWGCEPGQVKCMVEGACENYEFIKDISVNTVIYGPMFIRPNEENILFYIDSTAASSITWTLPDDVIIIQGQGSDSLLVNWGNRFENITLNIESTCGSEEISYEVFEAGQYPYPDIFEPHRIPGIIEAVDYDYGGEGLAYHDSNSGNEGPGPRQNNDVDTEYGDNGNPSVGWIASGEWLEYTIEVDSASYYEVSMRVATQNASGGPFSLLFNNEVLLSDITVANTGGWASFTTITAGTVYLTGEDSLMRIDFRNGGFNLGKITFTPVDKPSNIGKTQANNHIKVYPVPAGEYLRLYSPKEISSYALYDLSGKKLEDSISLNAKELEIDISNLSRGVYLLITGTHDGKWQYNKVIKQ
ncbi:MAG: family 16 glycosylhydrolase [bacterium]